MMTNKNNSVLYTGVTNNLVRRVSEHKEKYLDGFTKKYNCSKLVWYELYQKAINAISREKQIKGGFRKKKEDLINQMNPQWNDLYEKIV
jgi:putative endonuclease